MAEQRPDEQKPPASGNGEGAEVARAQGSEPAAPLDPEQLRQFQQFQQFQDFLRYSEAQRQQGGGLVPSQSQPPTPPPGGPLQVAPPQPLPAPLPKIRAPRWLKRLGGKLLSALLLFIVLAIGGKLAYDYFFPGEDEDLPASVTGGGTYHTNHILSTAPYEAVRSVYDAIAQGLVPQACGRFDEPIQQKFAVDVGFADCQLAVQGLTKQVTNVNAYAESLPSSISEPLPGDTVRINSCDFSIEGGPALGVFTATKVEKGQWLITAHDPGPTTCPAPTSTR